MYEETILAVSIVTMFLDAAILYYLRKEVVLYRRVHEDELKLRNEKEDEKDKEKNNVKRL